MRTIAPWTLLVLMMQVLISGSPLAAPDSDAESLFGPADLASIAGEGRLTVGVNQSGRLTTCRWPSPGYNEHLAYATRSRSEPLLGVERWHGAAWALELDGQRIWIHDDRWTHQQVETSLPSTITIESVLKGRDIRLLQQIAVAPDGHSFVTRITLQGTFDTPPTAYWYANYSPSTRLIPHVPIRPKTMVDFAAFIDPNLGTICHFRPEDPSSHVWRAARALADEPAQSEDWPEFPGGRYIIYGTPNNVTSRTVGPEQGPASVVDQVSAGSLSSQLSFVGQSASAIAMNLTNENDGYTATIYTAFGTNYAEAAQRYAAASANRVEFNTNAIDPDESDAADVMRRAVSTIHTCTDAETGSVVRAPTNTPPLAIDWPRYGIWIALAHDAAGDHNRATRILTFYVSHVRKQIRGDLPIGSIAAGLYTNGVEATPEAMIDAAAAGRLLWALARHATYLENDQLRPYYQGIWESVNATADFLVQWREPGGRGPLYTFDYESMHDRRTTELYVASYLGVNAANRIANALSDPRPDWNQAAEELKAALQFHAMYNDAEIATANPGILYDTRMAPGLDTDEWAIVIRRMLAATGDRTSIVELEALCKLVLSARDIPEELRVEIITRVKRHLDRETPDSAIAAFAYLIAHRVHSLRIDPPRPIQELSPDTP